MAESDLGEVGPGYTPLDLIGQATTRALDDAGLKKEEVDGFFSASAYYHMPTLSVGEYLGIRPRYSDATNMGGSFCQQPDVNVALTHGNGGVFSSQVTAILGSEETL